MEKKFFYKLTDGIDEDNSICFWTNKECRALIKKAVKKYDDDGTDYIFEFVKEELSKNSVKFSIIDFEEVKY